MMDNKATPADQFYGYHVFCCTNERPTMVVYPEGIWYRCETNEEIDQVLTQHVQNGEPEKHLMLDVNE